MGNHRDSNNWWMALGVPLGLAAGWAAGALSARRLVRRELGELRSLLTAQREGKDTAPAAAPAVQAGAIPPPPPQLEQPEEIAPDIILVLSAAVAAFLGKRARIRSARLVRPSPSNIWAQQGRVFVQASHNLGIPRHGH